MTYSIPQELENLDHKYHFFVKSGQVVGEPSRDGDTLHFFLTMEGGAELDITLHAARNVRPGHKVVVLYAAKNGSDEGPAVGWINLTTGAHEVFKSSINDLAGGGIALGLMRGIGGMLEGISRMASGGGLIFAMVMLPILVMYLMIAGAAALVALLLSSKPFKNAKKIRHRTQEILVDIAPEQVSLTPEKNTKAQIAFVAFCLLVVFPMIF